MRKFLIPLVAIGSIVAVATGALAALGNAPNSPSQTQSHLAAAGSGDTAQSAALAARGPAKNTAAVADGGAPNVANGQAAAAMVSGTPTADSGASANANLDVGAAALARQASDSAAQPLPTDEPRKGLIYRDLARGRKGGPCEGAFELPTVASPKATAATAQACTHGPDNAPEGIDVSVNTPLLSPTEVAATPGIVCDGDGVSGYRTLAIYAVAADKTDRYATVLPSIKTWAGNVDKMFADSAAQTGGVRRVRFETDANCDLRVVRVVLSASGDDSFSNTINELTALGFNRSDRRYSVWMDANVYCGIGQLYYDDRAEQTNYNNGSGGALFARTDAGCWGGFAEAHELMHTLGSVQRSAPHVSAAGHCTDEYDIMCYQDGAVTMTYPCSSALTIFDCNKDDYFHTNPPAGSYLATHWNTANSRFLLTTTGGGGTTTTTSTSTTAPTSTTSSTSTTTTSTTSRPPTNSWSWSGTLNKQRPSVTYTFAPTAAGDAAVTLNPVRKGRNATTWTVAVYGTGGAGGTLLGTASGAAGTTIVLPIAGLPSGNYSLRITGSGDYAVNVSVS